MRKGGAAVPDLAKSEYYWSFSEDFPNTDMWFLKSPVQQSGSYVGGLLPRVRVGGFGSFNHFPLPYFFLPKLVILDALREMQPNTDLIGTSKPIMPNIKSTDESDFTAGLSIGALPAVPNLEAGINLDASKISTIKLNVTEPKLSYLYPKNLLDLRRRFDTIRKVPGCESIDEGSTLR